MDGFGKHLSLGKHSDATDDARIETLAFGEHIKALHFGEKAFDLIDGVVEQ